MEAYSLGPTNCSTAYQVGNDPGIATFVIPISTNSAFTNVGVLAVSTPFLDPHNLPLCWSLNGKATNVAYLDATRQGLYNVAFSCGQISLTNLIWVTSNSDVLSDLQMNGPLKVGWWLFNNNLLDWWPGESNAFDYAGTNAGTTNGAVSYAPGILGTAFDFGGDGSVTFGTNVGNFGTNDFAINFWMQTRAKEEQAVIEKRPACGENNMWGIRMVSTGQLGIVVDDSRVEDGSYEPALGHIAVNDGNFHEVTFCRIGTNVELYVDGLLDLQLLSFPVINLSNNAPLRVGDSACTGVDGTVDFTGIIDEIRISGGQNGAPLITQGPVSQGICANEPIELSVAAIGLNPLSYQWQWDGANISGATNSEYFPPSITNSVGTYTVIVSNPLGASSASAILTVGTPPVITQQPYNLVAPAGTNATFAVTASQGTCDATYQWYKAGYGNLVDGLPWPTTAGGQSNVLTLYGVSSSDAGTYSVIISNVLGAVTSSTVTLTVTYTNTTPPTISKITPILSSEQSSGFSIPFITLLGASDAKDYNRQSISFKVSSVTNGQLFIDGAPFQPQTATTLGNCLLTVGSSIVWSPGITVPIAGAPAFSVYAFDGQLQSTNAVPVTIVPIAPTELLWWGWPPNPFFPLKQSSPVPVPIGFPKTATSAASGWDGDYVAVLTGEGTVWGLGPDADFRWGLPGDQGWDITWTNTPNLLQMETGEGTNLGPLTNVVSVSVGSYAAFAVLYDGSLHTWGLTNEIPFNGYGALGRDASRDPGVFNQATPFPGMVTGLTNSAGASLSVLQVVCDSDKSGTAAGLALCSDHSIWWWGSANSSNGLYYFTPTTNTFLPTRLTNFDSGSPVTQIAGASGHYVFLRQDGTVWELGLVPRLETAYNVGYYTNNPVKVPGVSNAMAIATSPYYSVALLTNSSVMQWGYQTVVFSSSETFGTSAPYLFITNAVPVTGLTNITQVSASIWTFPDTGTLSASFLGMAVDKQGRTWTWGMNPSVDPQTANSSAFFTNAVRNPYIENAISVTAAPRNAFAVGSLITDRPVNLVTTALSNKVALKWQEFSSAVSYRVYRSLQTGGPYTLAGSSTTPPFTDMGLSNGTTYYYVVTAVVASRETPYSDEASATPISPPAAPHWDPAYGSGSGVVALCREIDLHWTNANGALSYTVFRGPASTGPWAELGATSATNFSDQATISGVNYYYYFTAGNSAGNTASSVVGPVTNGVGCGPTPVITFLAITNTGSVDDVHLSVNLQWTYPSNASQYDFQISYYMPLVGEVPPDITTEFKQATFSLPSPSPPVFGACVIDLQTNSPVWLKVTPFIDGALGADSQIVGPIILSPSTPPQPQEVTAAPGNQQVYLQWRADATTPYYSVQYQTNGTNGTWKYAGSNIVESRFWHTNLANGTNYDYRVIGVQTVAGLGGAFAITSAPSMVVTSMPLGTLSNISASTLTVSAAGFDQMVYLQWTNSVNALSDQYFVERKLQGTGDSNYIVISDTGLGFAFADNEVIDGVGYTYRVTAMDTNYVRVRVTTNATPTADGALHLAATPGNGYVKLTWNPAVPGATYQVLSGVSSNGPFGFTSASLTKTSYLDTNVNNGVTEYYEVMASLPAGTNVASGLAWATPSGALQPLPPPGFQAVVAGANIFLFWNSSVGASAYQLSQTLPPDKTLEIGPGLGYTFAVPSGTPFGTTFNFKVRAESPTGLWSDASAVSVDYTNGVDLGVTNSLALSIGGNTVNSNFTALTFVGPTNLVLTAAAKTTNTSELDTGTITFYDGGTTIGSAPGPTTQIVWHNPTAGTLHQVSAQYVAGGSSALHVGAGAACESYTAVITVNVTPPLTTYQSAVTDLQLPAPGLPIVISRSYDSRLTNAPAHLGAGWQENWDTGGLKIANGNLATGWGYGGTDLGGNTYVVETTSHAVSVTLPGGSVVYFSPVLQTTGNPNFGDASATLAFNPYGPNEGTLNYSGSGPLYVSDAYVLVDEDDNEFEFKSYVYTTPSRVQYFFDLNGQLQSITDINGNSLTYSYTNGNQLSGIAHSNGLQVSFSYTTNGQGSWIYVYDTVGPAGSGANPALRYLLTSNNATWFLKEVDQLVDRTAGTYQSTVYGWGGSTNSVYDQNRLIQIWDGRGVLTTRNVYTNSSGTNPGQLLTQLDARGHSSTYAFNSGQLQVTRLVSGSNSTVTVTHDQSGAVISSKQAIGDPNYTGTSYQYDTRGLLISQKDSYGNRQQTDYDSLLRPVRQTDALGHTTSTALNDMGEPLTATDANGNTTTNVYDDFGNMTQSVDSATNISTTTYLPAVTDSSHHVLAGGLVSKAVSTSSESPGATFDTVTLYTYHTGTNGANGNLAGDVASVVTEQLDGTGAVRGTSAPTLSLYDGNGNLLVQTQIGTVKGIAGQAVETRYGYDGMNRVVRTIDPLFRMSTTTYDGAGHVVLSVDVLGRSTTNVYDAIGNLIETDYPDGTVSRMTYDEMNHVLYTQDRCVPVSGVTTGAATLNVYDTAGRTVRVERLSGVAMQRVTDTGVVEQSGVVMQTISVTSGGTRVSFTRSGYDWNGRLTTNMAANGAVTLYQYDAAGRRTAEIVYTNYFVSLSSVTNAIAPSGGALTNRYQYDANGNQTAVIDGNGRETDYQYDGGNRVYNTLYPLNAGESARHQVTDSYDSQGNKLQESDEAGVLTVYRYDWRGLLSSVTLDGKTAQAQVWSYGYDEFGNLTRVTDPLAGVTQYQYDELGRRTLRELSDGTVERTAYADVPVGGGLKVAQTLVTDWRGATTVTTEDLMGRLWTRELPGMNAGDPDTVETYAYAASGQVAQVVVTTNGATNRITYYAYDGLNRLTNKDCPEGVLGYTWTADNHVQSITAYRRGLVATHGVITNGTPADVSLSYGYDYAGRLSTVTNSGTVAANYGYDNVGNLAAVVEKGVATNWFAYNAQNRLTTLTVTNAGKMGRQYSYGLGPTGARTNVLELTQPAGSLQQRWGAAWEYDGRYGTNAVPARAYRLTRETLTNATDWAAAITNVYDAVGNRLTRSVGLAITPVEALTNQSFRYDRRDLIDSDTVANNANTNYDADGNTLVDNGAPTGDRYDAENRLIGRGTTITQVYDMDGNRARKTVSGVTTYYLVDDQNPTGYAQVLAEYANPSNAPAVTYAYGLALVSQTRSGTTSWYGFDGQGNVRFLMNGSGTITDSYDYDAFGRLLAQTGTTSNSCRFAGQQWDSDLGLYYMRARYLKTDLGRFWTSDTLEGSQDEPLGLHRYLYCNGTPINEIDPSGEIYVPSRSDIGNYIHWYIGTDFQSTGSKRFFGTPISRILNVRWIPGLTASQPDLAQQPQGNRSGEVYEIKPSGSYLEGRTQLQYYLRILNHLDPKKRFWDAGTASTYSPPNVIILGPAVLAEVHPPQNGVILYDVVDLRKIVALVAVAAGIDIKIGVAEATLVDTVGAAP